MAPMADTSPAPAPTTAPGRFDGLAARFDLRDPRNLVGLGVLAFCAGIIVGARIMRGATAPPKPAPGVLRVNPAGGVTDTTGTPVQMHPDGTGHPKDQPCAGCREKAIQQARQIAGQEAARLRRLENAPEPTAADTDAAERGAAADRQLAGVDGLKTFSAYAESILPEEMVTSGDSSVPPEG